MWIPVFPFVYETSISPQIDERQVIPIKKPINKMFSTQWEVRHMAYPNMQHPQIADARTSVRDVIDNEDANLGNTNMSAIRAAPRNSSSGLATMHRVRRQLAPRNRWKLTNIRPASAGS